MPAASALAGGTAGPTAAAEDLVAHVKRLSGGWDAALYARLLGHANALKEGDAIVGVAAADEAARIRARALLARTGSSSEIRAAIMAITTNNSTSVKAACRESQRR